MALLVSLLALASSAAAASATGPAYALLERLLPGASDAFHLELSTSAKDLCFTVSDRGGQVSVVAGDVSLLTAGVGYYLREHVNLTVGWPRGGGSSLVRPAHWPKIGGAMTQCRRAAHS